MACARSSTALLQPVRLPRHASRGWSRVGTRLPCTDRAVRDSFLLAFGSFEKPAA